VSRLLKQRGIIALLLIWMIVCPGFLIIDGALSANKVERWMEREGITQEDIMDIEMLQRDIARGGGDLFAMNLEKYVKNMELAIAVKRVAESPHEWPFLWDYQRSDYQRPIGIGLTILTLTVLITKELMEGIKEDKLSQELLGARQSLGGLK